MSPALSGILTAIAVFVGAGVVAFWSRRWSVWAVTILSVVAFHLWTADVYEGAPAPVTGFLASVSKAAAFLATLRQLLELDLLRYPTLIECTALIAIFSMLFGNLLALKQHPSGRNRYRPTWVQCPRKPK